MPAFDLAESLRNAERRMTAAGRSSSRRSRADRGRSRLDPRVLEVLSEVVSTPERPAMATMLAALGSRCRRMRLPAPSRATVYKLLDVLPTRSYRVSELPAAVRRALYNLDGVGEVPGHQLAFYCFNYGDLAAASFAAGLPWLAVRQALRLPGWRARSRGLAEAVARTRRI